MLGPELPLDDHVGAPHRDARIVEQRPQDRGRSRERQVRHDGERLFGPRPPDGVGLHDADGAESAAQIRNERGVSFDGDDSRAGAHERRGQRTAARAEVHDKVAARNAGLADDRLGKRPTPKEVLPAGTACRRPSNGHGSPSWSRDDRSADESRVNNTTVVKGVQTDKRARYRTRRQALPGYAIDTAQAHRNAEQPLAMTGENVTDRPVIR